MELQEIEVFIDEKGEVQIEVRGVKGKKCLDLTEDLEEALGGEVAARELKPEAYETAKEGVRREVEEEQRLHGGR
jgi:hypothetical protein